MYDYERCYYKTFEVKQRNTYENFYRLIIYRGFGFITFKDANAVDKVLTKDVHMLDEKQVCTIYTSV